MNKEYVLITGTTGFMGSYVTEKLLSDKSYRIVAIVRKNKNYKNVEELKYKGVILVEGSFYDIDFLVSQLARNEKWSTRILLISKSWYYDISETVNTFPYVPTRTRDSLIRSMQIYLSICSLG